MPAHRPLLADPVRDRAQWHKLRERKLSASRLASALDFDKRRSPLVTWEQVMGLAAEDALLDNERVEAGMMLEPAIAAWYELRTRRMYAPSPGLLAHPTHDWIVATPDGWSFDHELHRAGRQPWGCLEIKNVDSMFESDWSPQPPAAYQIQIQVTMDCMGVEWGDFAVCFGGNKLRVFRQVRNQSLLDEAYTAGELWYRTHVLGNVPPDLTPDEGAVRVWKKLHPKDNGQRVQCPPEIVEAVDLFDEMSARAKEVEKAKEIAKAKIMQAIGDATFLVMPDGSGFSFKTQESHFEAQPARTSETRVLRRVKRV